MSGEHLQDHWSSGVNISLQSRPIFTWKFSSGKVSSGSCNGILIWYEKLKNCWITMKVKAKGKTLTEPWMSFIWKDHFKEFKFSSYWHNNDFSNPLLILREFEKWFKLMVLLSNENILLQENCKTFYRFESLIDSFSIKFGFHCLSDSTVRGAWCWNKKSESNTRTWWQHEVYRMINQNFIFLFTWIYLRNLKYGKIPKGGLRGRVIKDAKL